MWDPACACFAAAPPKTGHAASDFGPGCSSLALNGRSPELPRNLHRKYAEQRMSVDKGFSYGEDEMVCGPKGRPNGSLAGLLGRTGEAKSLVAVIESRGRRMAGSMPQVSEGYRLGSCWIPIRPSTTLFPIATSWRSLVGCSCRRGSIPLRRQKTFRS